ncbi:MAG: DUF4157 domain-containing protein, partial [Proteobacteria bacterium]|nr:DUF4157 domain-containing protein [Pseudomonadota bacterium]
MLHPERAPGKSHHPDDDALRSGEPGKRTRHGEVPADVLAERGEPGKGADAGELGAAFAFLPPPPSAPQTPIMRHATVGGLAPQISRAELDALLAGSQGRALPEALRAELQRRLGDLDDVRVHVGTAASTAAKVLHADAFAVGRDIYFADGKFDPASADGQRLIAHEVAHTAQRVGPSSGANIAISTPGDAHEHAADAFADDFASAILPGAGAHATPAAATRSLGSTSFTGISRAPAAGAPPAATPATPATATFDPSMLKTGVGSVAKAGTVKQVQAMRMGSSVVVQTPGVLMNGTVALKPNTDPGPDVDAGWVQTVVSSVRIGLYYKDGELVQRDITRFESTRDGKAGVTKPWYEPPSRLSKTQPDVYPVAEDQPKMQLPAELNGAKLTEIQGADKFKVSLKVGVGTNLTTLQSFEWEAPWAVKLDADQAGTGGDVRVAPTSVHDAPATDRPANEVGTDEKNKVQT